MCVTYEQGGGGVAFSTDHESKHIRSLSVLDDSPPTPHKGPLPLP